MSPIRISRLSDSRKKKWDDQHLKVARDSIAASRKALKDNPKPDTFAGRKTQETLPKIDKA